MLTHSTSSSSICCVRYTKVALYFAIKQAEKKYKTVINSNYTKVHNKQTTALKNLQEFIHVDQNPLSLFSALIQAKCMYGNVLLQKKNFN